MVRFLSAFLLALILVGCSATEVGVPPSDDVTSGVTRVPLRDDPVGGVGSGRLIVVLHEDVVSSASTFSSVASVAGAELVDSFGSLGILVLEAPPLQLASVVDGLVADARVRSVELSQPVVLWNAGVPWELDRLNQRALPLDSRVLSDSSAGAGVRVYVIDSGVDGRHPSLRGRVLPGVDLARRSGGVDGWGDCGIGHGTGVASKAAGVGYGVAVAAVIVPVKVFLCENSTLLEEVISAMNWVLEDAVAWGGPSIVNMSFGASFSPALNAATDRLADANLLPVVAAGNSPDDACGLSPASAVSALTVGASVILSTTKRDTMTTWSARGRCVTVLAPGEGVLTANLEFGSGGLGHHVVMGTSFSAPLVAGLAARYWGKFPDASQVEVGLHVLESSTKDLISVDGYQRSVNPGNLAFAPAVVERGDDGVPGDFKCVFCISTLVGEIGADYNVRTSTVPFDVPPGRKARISFRDVDSTVSVKRMTVYLEIRRGRMWWPIAYHDVNRDGYVIDVPARTSTGVYRIVARAEERNGTTMVIEDTTHERR